jgi:CRISPR-associated endonuclease/helicase Cas3
VIGSAWVDEFDTQISDHNEIDLKGAIEGYRSAHSAFIEKRVAKLAVQPAKRKASVLKTELIIEQNQLLPITDAVTHKTKEAAYFETIANETAKLHGKHNTVDISTGLKVSFGVIRVANISPCVNLTRFLLEDYSCDSDTEIRVMCYHSQQVLLMRAEQEEHLDNVLKRKEKEGQEPLAFSNNHIRHHLDTTAKKANVKNVIFILIATPVEEVGRDHDFDWAIIEPSSYRSIIQLAGRVRRHRGGDVNSANISILQHNVKTLKQNTKCEKPAFEKPGFETNRLLLKSHDLTELIDEELILTKLDAVPRIQKSAHHNARYFNALASVSEMRAISLAELEHASIWSEIANYASKGNNKQFGPNTFQGYLRESWWLTGLPQVFFRFRDGNSGINTYLTYLHEQETFKFCEKDEQGSAIDRQTILGIQQVELSVKAVDRLWLYRDYSKSIKKTASQNEKSLYWTSLRYGELNFIHQEGKSYEYNDQFGLIKQYK